MKLESLRGVLLDMDKLRSALTKAYSVSRNSWGGRLLFVSHVLFVLRVIQLHDIGCAMWTTSLFMLVDLPQFIVLDLTGVPLTKSEISSAVFIVVISLPWWAYGVAAEFAIRRLVSSRLLLSARSAQGQVSTPNQAK